RNMRNHTELHEFILLGIPQTEGLETVLFVNFSFIYLFTRLGNLLILTTIVSSSTLHTPMYFFLGLLSIFDMLFPSVTCPKMLFYLSGQSHTISYKGCAAQLFFYHFLGATEGCLYSVMAYDRFVAICHPLRYMLIMRPGVCVSLVMAAWLVGCLHATILTSFTFQVDSSIEMRNHTMVTEFILLGIPETEGLETVLFFLFSSLYLCTLLGNVLILTAIISSSWLHTPMYFFLGNLSMFDLGFSSTTVPKMLLCLSRQNQGISFQGCVSQVFFYHFLGCTECFLYTVMAYDRFVAICYPLRYMVIMNHRVCSILATGTWMGGCVHAIILTSLTFQLPYCGSNQVGYYFCDIPAVLPLACGDVSLAQRVGFTNVGLLSLICFFLILVSYTRIGISISKIRSAEGRQRAFSTCSAHLTAILCAYGPV
ncbi:OL958 protein, partial [Crocuta crocuta]